MKKVNFISSVNDKGLTTLQKGRIKDQFFDIILGGYDPNEYKEMDIEKTKLILKELNNEIISSKLIDDYITGISGNLQFEINFIKKLDLFLCGFLNSEYDNHASDIGNEIFEKILDMREKKIYNGEDFFSKIIELKNCDYDSLSSSGNEIINNIIKEIEEYKSIKNQKK